MTNPEKALKISELINKLYKPNLGASAEYLAIITGLAALFAILATVIEKRTPEFFEGCKVFGLVIILALLYAPIGASVLENRKKRWSEISQEAALYLCKNPKDHISIDDFLDSRYRDTWWRRIVYVKCALPSAIKEILQLLLDEGLSQEPQESKALESSTGIPSTLSAVLIRLSRFLGNRSPVAKQEKQPTSEQAEFIERKAEETFRYVLESYDIAKAEGKNILQWLFAAVFGGLGFTGTLVKNGYYSVAIGVLFALFWAAWSAARLLHTMQSQDMIPPGNTAEYLKSYIHDALPVMRLREAEELEYGNITNRKTVGKVAEGVDRARRAIAWIPVWFICAAVGTAVLRCYAPNCAFIEFIRKLPL